MAVAFLLGGLLRFDGGIGRVKVAEEVVEFLLDPDIDVHGHMDGLDPDGVGLHMDATRTGEETEKDTGERD